jgi:protein-tyrosine phosphatase
MFTKIYWLHTFENAAQLGIMARPRGDDWLEDEIINLKIKNVGLLVSLLEKDEINELKLNLESAFCKAKGIDFINFPIVDRDMPSKNEQTEQFIDLLTARLKAGISIVIHCRMGIGRSSIIAAAVLLKFGFNVDATIENISAFRGLKIPDTDEQIKWLKAREK